MTLEIARCECRDGSHVSEAVKRRCRLVNVRGFGLRYICMLCLKEHFDQLPASEGEAAYAPKERV